MVRKNALLLLKLCYTLCCLLTMVYSFSQTNCLTCPKKNTLVLQGELRSEEFDSFSDIESSYDEDSENAITESDWVQAELTLINAPTEPNPDLDAIRVAMLICRSLQFVDYPNQNDGLKRCYPFMTYDCRASVTAGQGAKSVERFIEYGLLSPALQPFMGATRMDLGDTTFTEATPPLRGALISFPVFIEGARILSLQHQSGFDRTGVSAPQITKMVLRLEQQRRPPDQGCWMVREILDGRSFFRA